MKASAYKQYALSGGLIVPGIKYLRSVTGDGGGVPVIADLLWDPLAHPDGALLVDGGTLLHRALGALLLGHVPAHGLSHLAGLLLGHVPTLVVGVALAGAGDGDPDLAVALALPLVLAVLLVLGAALRLCVGLVHRLVLVHTHVLIHGGALLLVHSLALKIMFKVTNHYACHINSPLVWSWAGTVSQTPSDTPAHTW